MISNLHSSSAALYHYTPLYASNSHCMARYNLPDRSSEAKSMNAPDTDTHSVRRQDKQLQGIVLETVLQKRRLEQALSAKEFAVCAGISYSTARAWFQLPGFPVFQGIIFWQDFVQWRTDQTGLEKPRCPECGTDISTAASDLSKILYEGGRLGPHRSRRFNRRKGKSSDSPV